MPEAAIWAAFAATGTFILGLVRWVSSLSGRLTAAEAKATAADNIAARAVGKAELLATELAEFRVATAASIARVETKTAGVAENLERAETRIVRSIDDLGERIGDMSERLDRVLDGRPART